MSRYINTTVTNLINLVGIDRSFAIKQSIRYMKMFLRYSSIKKIKNLIICEYEFRMKKTQLKSMPYAIKVEVNNTCNLDCGFCPRNESTYGFGIASYDDFKKMFDQLKDYMYLGSYRKVTRCPL